MRVPWTCGYRTPALYVVEEPHKEDGSPVEIFIPCPTPYIDMEGIGLAATGMRIIERVDQFGLGTGIFDIWDYVSATDNPFVPDFIEQSRNYGTSRKLSPSVTKEANFKKLKADLFDSAMSSRHIYVHARAIIEDPAPFYEQRTGLHSCPQGIEEHDQGTRPWEMCPGLWWESVGARGPKERDRRHQVFVPRDWEKYGAPSCSYQADHIPDGVAPKFLTGIIMSIPLMKMEIPIDKSGDNEHDRLAKLLEDGGWQYNYEITPE